jgi:hypothetical protein
VGEEFAFQAPGEIRTRLRGGDVELRKVLLLFRHSATFLISQDLHRRTESFSFGSLRGRYDDR